MDYTADQLTVFTNDSPSSAGQHLRRAEVFESIFRHLQGYFGNVSIRIRAIGVGNIDREH